MSSDPQAIALTPARTARRQLAADGPADRDHGRHRPLPTDWGEMAPDRGPGCSPRLVADALLVLRGEGPVEGRIRLDAPDSDLPVRPGSLLATVFEHRGGQVAIVGPEDWWAGTCVRITVATSSLRPLDVAELDMMVLPTVSDRAHPSLEGHVFARPTSRAKNTNRGRVMCGKPQRASQVGVVVCPSS